MYKGLTQTYIIQALNRMYKCPHPISYADTSRNIQMYMGAWGHADVWGHSDIQGSSKHIGAYECGGVQILLSLTNPMPAS